jgi:hypothetical protein
MLLVSLSIILGEKKTSMPAMLWCPCEVYCVGPDVVVVQINCFTSFFSAFVLVVLVLAMLDLTFDVLNL